MGIKLEGISKVADGKKPKILITLKENGENGGPYISHRRIMNDEYLTSKFSFEILSVPRARYLINPIGFFKFVKSIKESKAELVHIAGLQLEGFFSMLACAIAKKRTVLAVHGSLSEALDIGKNKKRIYAKLEKYTLRRATVTYGVSEYVSSWDICKCAKNYFGTVYNISDFDCTTKKSSIREELNIKESDYVIVSTGRIVKDKGYDVLKDVILKFKEADNVKFVIAGDGAYREELQKEITKSGQLHQVFLLGYRSDIGNILDGADVFIICTKHETLCISLLEAAIHGLPMIATNVGGIPEIVDGENGYLIENEDVNGFVCALNELIKNTEKRNEMGLKAKKKAQEKFGKERIVQLIEQVYLETLSI